MEKNKTKKMEQKLLQNETTLSPQSGVLEGTIVSPQSKIQTVETYNYSKPNIHAVLELLNKIEIKGTENIKAVASIFYILEQPIDEGISEIKNNEK